MQLDYCICQGSCVSFEGSGTGADAERAFVHAETRRGVEQTRKQKVHVGHDWKIQSDLTVSPNTGHTWDVSSVSETCGKWISARAHCVFQAGAAILQRTDVRGHVVAHCLCGKPG